MNLPRLSAFLGAAALLLASHAYGLNAAGQHSFDRLAGRSGGAAGAVQAVYDGDGHKVRESVGGVTTSYLVDELNPTGYAQAVEELTNGAVTRVYTWGSQLISQDRFNPAGGTSGAGAWSASFYGFDGHGSVRLLTDQAGAVTDAYDYDAFGVLLKRQGLTDNRHLFCGEELDAALGLYNLRARLMDPLRGRFWTADEFEGNSSEPISLHKYLYAGSNPVLNSDPSGHETLAGLATGFSIQAIVVRSAVGGVIGAGDAYFRGYSISSGITIGAIGGVVGPLIPLRIGIGLSIYGISEALYNGDYRSAVYRAAVFGFGYALQAGGFKSFPEFKKFWGAAGRGRGWHHLVEQTPGNLAKFGPEGLHCPNNMVPLPNGKGTIHAKISGFYSSKQPRVTGSPNLTVRKWLANKSFEEQYEFGLQVLDRFGGGGGPIDVFGWTGGASLPAVLDSFTDQEDPASSFGQDGDEE